MSVSAGRWIVLVLIAVFAFGASAEEEPPRVVVGSKAFTESVILGEIVTLLLRARGVETVHRRALGDAATFQALLGGDIDVYPEYTGTLRLSIFDDLDLPDDAALSGPLAARGLGRSASLGFENTYAIGVRAEMAERLGLRGIGDLRGYPDLTFGVSETFLNRGDGWGPLSRAYGLPQRDVRGMQHELAYTALAGGSIDAMDVYTTDAQIAELDLVTLDDELNFFPAYEAVLVYREDAAGRAPVLLEVLAELEGLIDESEMRAMNAAVKTAGRSESAVAAAFLERELGVRASFEEETMPGRVLRYTGQHLVLVGVSMALGVSLAVPLGFVAHWSGRQGRYLIWAVGLGQTVPSLALLVVMVPLLGTGYEPAIAALFLYSMLPMIRNTHAGLEGIAPGLRESADALGLSFWARLVRVDLPLAMPSILAGVKTATVLSIGFATLGAFVGAGGYGTPILTAVRLGDFTVALEGAIPAAAMAVAAEIGFELLERRLLRWRRAESSGGGPEEEAAG